MKRPVINEATIVITDTPDDGVPVLFEGPPLDLPANAEQNPDGSVTLTLKRPFELKFRPAGSEQVARVEPYTHLLLRRLTGADVRKMIAAKNAADMALALSSGLGPAKLNMMRPKLDAADEGAAGEIVSELLGGMKPGLPAHAEEADDAVVLPLFKPAIDGQGMVWDRLTLKRLTAQERRQAADADNLLDWAVARATALSPKLAKGVVDDMDGADAMGVNQVILFLCGSGRRTGR